MDFGVKV